MLNSSKYRTLIGAVCEDLVNGTLPQSISARAVCARYSVSREPALRALRILRECGLLEMGRGRQSRITHEKAGKEDPPQAKPSAAAMLAKAIETQIFNGVYAQGSNLPKTNFFA